MTPASRRYSPRLSLPSRPAGAAFQATLHAAFAEADPVIGRHPYALTIDDRGPGVLSFVHAECLPESLRD
jgi:hypothetical protein